MDPKLQGLLLGVGATTVLWIIGVFFYNAHIAKKDKDDIKDRYGDCKMLHRLSKGGQVAAEFLSWRWDFVEAFIRAQKVLNIPFDPDVEVLEIVVMPGNTDHLQYVSDAWRGTTQIDSTGRG